MTDNTHPQHENPEEQGRIQLDQTEYHSCQYRQNRSQHVLSTGQIPGTRAIPHFFDYNSLPA